MGQANELLITTTVQDTDPSFKYTLDEQWNRNPDNVGMFSGGSGQYVYLGLRRALRGLLIFISPQRDIHRGSLCRIYVQSERWSRSQHSRHCSRLHRASKQLLNT